MRLSNENIKRGLISTVEVVKKGCMIAAPIVAATLINGKAEEIVNKMRYCGEVGYDDAVRVILDSDMLSSYRKEAVSLVKVGRGSDYYRAIIHAVGSSLMSSDRVDLIRRLSEAEESQ